MKAVVAIDSFKGSFSSAEAASIVTQVFNQNGIQSTGVILADGGEGTSEAFLINHGDGQWLTATVHDPCGNLVVAKYGYIAAKRLAVIDAAMASGLALVQSNGKFVDPMTTTSTGTGELIAAAVKHGATQVIVGLGGTGTTDAGLGLLGALGAKFYNNQQQLLPVKPSSLDVIDHIDLSAIVTKKIKLVACSDVDGYLTGPSGAVQMFGPQKGLTDVNLVRFERWFQRFAQQVDPQAKGQVAGDGAAGGMGFALRLLGATMTPGFQLLSEVAKLKDKIADADIVVTGEGQLDQQSLHGKLPVQVAQLARQYHKPCFCVAGRIQLTMSEIQAAGFTSAFSLVQQITDLDHAIGAGKHNLSLLMERLAPLLV
ncbi:glycerate kinase [Lactobacillus plantarum] [Lactiplantibacillus mudanjiangensis]|uniref:glycerate kinase family protein n=1 Tax=Lactiplantibacillus mudanjiangensis TaxID=1296538 RepID=UPI001014F3E1|nr:glycerate kinase [Lactobacillus plantarum] [Lactiplantibacillus mudanjiangensis]